MQMAADPSFIMESDGFFGRFFAPHVPRFPQIFKCPDCSFMKSSSEDLEIHIKTEHLNWLPFHCPFCAASRASDGQMREHIHSHHKKNELKYIYMDNPRAKRALQEMMDRALLGASISLSSVRRVSNLPNENGKIYSNNVTEQNLDNGYCHSKQSSYGTLFNSSMEGFNYSASHDELPKKNQIGATVNVLPKKNTSEDMLAKIQNKPSDSSADIGIKQPAHRLPSNITERTSGMDEDNYAEEGLFESDGAFFSEDLNHEHIDDLTNSQLSHIFGGPSRLKSEFDPDALRPPKSHNEMDNLPDETDDGSSALKDVAALFSASATAATDRSDSGCVMGMHDEQHSPTPQHHRNVSMSSTLNGGTWMHPPHGHTMPDGVNPGKKMRFSGLTAKRRVLGECAKCHRPITAGARQMHIFYHLGKDHNTFRFRCKHPGCLVEHYRKDQMENHHSKVHGKVDPEMMEDRSVELYNVCQKLSMELLGTSGNTPGPTAAKAQVVYDSLQRGAELTAFRKRRRPGMSGPPYPAENSFDQGPANGAYNSPYSIYGTEIDGDKKFTLDLNMNSSFGSENLECLLCHKFIMSRIRGFHILWHLSNDLNIIRYGCRFCSFKHDRPQSITNHGKREHNSENCCEDLLYRYEDEVKSMSKACFGVEKIFAKEIRRRNQEQSFENNNNIPISNDCEELSDVNSNENDEEAEYDNRSNDDASKDVQQPTTSSIPVGHKKKSKSMRRFGIRRPKSRKQKEEVAKLREISMHLGGAQYFRKRCSETVVCKKCGRCVTSRLSDHAYSHLDSYDLFRCPCCNTGHFSRETMLRHIKDYHDSNEQPIDNRLKYAHEIKQSIRECYPENFVDAPIPTKEEIDKLKANLQLTDMVLTDANGNEQEEEEEDETNDTEGSGERCEDDDEDANSRPEPSEDGAQNFEENENSRDGEVASEYAEENLLKDDDEENEEQYADEGEDVQDEEDEGEEPAHQENEVAVV